MEAPSVEKAKGRTGRATWPMATLVKVILVVMVVFLCKPLVEARHDM